MLFELSMVDLLSRYLTDQRLIDALAGQGIIGTYASPYDPGTAAVHFHHSCGWTNGRRGAWGFVRGGLGQVSCALAGSAAAAGAVIITGVTVANGNVYAISSTDVYVYSVSGTKLDEFAEQIETQLRAYREAQTAVEKADEARADADSALSETRFLIEETTIATDEVVVDAFMNPPSEQALETLATPSLAEATVLQYINPIFAALLGALFLL